MHATTEVSNMARINLSIPDSLKKQMDEVDLNWSSLAADAFQHAVLIDRMKGDSPIEVAALENLREQRNKFDEVEEAQGVARGRAWALNKASYEWLEAVAKVGTDRASYGFEPLEAVYYALEEFFGSKLAIDEEVFQRQRPSEAFAGGFIDGAAEVFDEV